MSQLCSLLHINSHWVQGRHHWCAHTLVNQLQCCQLPKVCLTPVTARKKKNVTTFWKSHVDVNCFCPEQIFISCFSSHMSYWGKSSCMYQPSMSVLRMSCRCHCHYQHHHYHHHHVRKYGLIFASIPEITFFHCQSRQKAKRSGIIGGLIHSNVVSKALRIS